jgi:hypothetical protein
MHAFVYYLGQDETERCFIGSRGCIANSREHSIVHGHICILVIAHQVWHPHHSSPNFCYLNHIPTYCIWIFSFLKLMYLLCSCLRSVYLSILSMYCRRYKATFDSLNKLAALYGNLDLSPRWAEAKLKWPEVPEGPVVSGGNVRTRYLQLNYSVSLSMNVLTHCAYIVFVRIYVHMYVSRNCWQKLSFYGPCMSMH